MLQRLLIMLGSICQDVYEILLFRSAFSLAFFGALRVSEFTAPNARSISPLLASDVVVLRDSVRLRIARSKTDQYGQGTWLTISEITHEFCPVCLLRTFIEMRRPGASFLIHQNDAPLTRFQFSSMFKKGLAALGLPTAEFGTHSFRIGAATVADASGLSEELVKRLGRWRSECFRRYIRPNLLTL